jgi:hypothetical protein
MLSSVGKWLLLMVAFAALVLLVLQLRRSEPDGLVLPTPEWMRPAAAPRETSTPATADVESPERFASPIADMLPAAELSKALVATKQEVKFTAAVPLDAGMSAEVAQEVVRAVDMVWVAYKATELQGPTHISRCQEMLFAAWPTLNDRMRDGQVTVEVGPIPPGNSGSYGTAGWSVDERMNALTAGLFTPRWLIKVRVDFTKDGDLLKLFNTYFKKE